MAKPSDSYRAAFRSRHANARKQMRRADVAAAQALEALNPPKAPDKAPLGNREARRRLRQKTRLELRNLEKGE